MGDLVKLSCAECGREWKVKTGAGMLHGIPENIKAEFPEKIREDVDRMLKSDEGLAGLTFQFSEAVCSDCGSIVSAPVLYTLKKDKSKTVVGTCPECGKKVKIIRDLNKTGCPGCGKKALSRSPEGLWD